MIELEDADPDADWIRLREIEDELRKPRHENRYWRDPAMRDEYLRLLERRDARIDLPLAPLAGDAARKAEIEAELRKGRDGAYWRKGSFMPEEYRAILEREGGASHPPNIARDAPALLDQRQERSPLSLDSHEEGESWSPSDDKPIPVAIPVAKQQPKNVVFDKNAPSLTAYHPTLEERTKYALQDALMALGGTAYGAGDFADRLTTALGFTPAGIAFSADDLKRAIQNKDPIGAAIAALGLMPLAKPEAAAIRKAAKGTPLASRSPELNDPPPAQGRLRRDIEGRPLVAQHKVGRNTVGGDDVPYPDRELSALTRIGTGQIERWVPPGKVDESFGWTHLDPITGKPTLVEIANDLKTQIDRIRTHKHENGHVVHKVADKLSAEGLEDELALVYHHLNADDPRSLDLFSPAGRGYKPHQFANEYLAEAVRAYLTDPNYMKTVAPRTAAAIRAAVNTNPTLSKFIQFNALPLTAGAGYYATSDGRSRKEHDSDL